MKQTSTGLAALARRLSRERVTADSQRVVQGKVTDLRGHPLAGAVVQLRQYPSAVRCNLTQADGFYRFGGLAAGGAWELVAMYGGSRSTTHLLLVSGSGTIRINLEIPVSGNTGDSGCNSRVDRMANTRVPAQNDPERGVR